MNRNDPVASFSLGPNYLDFIFGDVLSLKLSKLLNPTEVVLVFRPVCILVKMDQGFI